MMDPDEEWNTWVEWLGEEPGGRHIWREVSDMLVRREVWDSFAIVYNIAIHSGGPRELTENPNFPIWIKNNYLDAQVMAIRRQLDMRHDVISLRRLLEHVANYPQVLSRDRYTVRTADWQSPAQADEFFDQMVGSGLDHIDPSMAKANLANLKTWTRKVRDFADKEKAHYGEAPSRLAEDQTIGDLHHAVDVIVDMAVKYRELILGSSMDKRVVLLPWTQIFGVPWVPADQMAHVNRTISDLEAKRARGEPLTDEDFR